MAMFELFDQDEFNDFILENKVIGFYDEPVTLKSGRTSHWYVNWRKPSEDVVLIDELSDYVTNFIDHHDLKPHTIYGVPEGATKLALIAQYNWAVAQRCKVGEYVLSMGRGKPKDHGKLEDRFFLGMPKGRTVVIEDVTTTGNSLLGTIDQLVQAKVHVVAAIGLTNRNERRDDGSTVEEALKREGIPYVAMSNGCELLPLAAKKYKPVAYILKGIEREFEQYGEAPLQLR